MADLLDKVFKTTVFEIASSTRGQTAEARRSTILQKDRQDEKAEGYVPDEGAR